MYVLPKRHHVELTRFMHISMCTSNNRAACLSQYKLRLWKSVACEARALWAMSHVVWECAHVGTRVGTLGNEWRGIRLSGWAPRAA